MNKLAKFIGMHHTIFSNPHGLADKGNKSTTEDLAKLAVIIQKEFYLVKKIVKKDHYCCKP